MPSTFVCQGLYGPNLYFYQGCGWVIKVKLENNKIVRNNELIFTNRTQCKISTAMWNPRDYLNFHGILGEYSQM